MGGLLSLGEVRVVGGWVGEGRMIWVVDQWT